MADQVVSRERAPFVRSGQPKQNPMLPATQCQAMQTDTKDLLKASRTSTSTWTSGGCTATSIAPHIAAEKWVSSKMNPTSVRASASSRSCKQKREQFVS